MTAIEVRDLRFTQRARLASSSPAPKARLSSTDSLKASKRSVQLISKSYQGDFSEA